MLNYHINLNNKFREIQKKYNNCRNGKFLLVSKKVMLIMDSNENE